MDERGQPVGIVVRVRGRSAIFQTLGRAVTRQVVGVGDQGRWAAQGHAAQLVARRVRVGHLRAVRVSDLRSVAVRVVSIGHRLGSGPPDKFCVSLASCPASSYV